MNEEDLDMLKVLQVPASVDEWKIIDSKILDFLIEGQKSNSKYKETRNLQNSTHYRFLYWKQVKPGFTNYQPQFFWKFKFI